MATPTSQPCALPVGLRYYLLRGTVMVPLVPVDQLPFQLQGVPRQLSHRQMSDEDWKMLKETEEPLSSLSIQAPTTVFPSPPVTSVNPRFLAPDHHIRKEAVGSMRETPPPRQWAARSGPAELVSDPPGSAHAVMPERPSSLTDSFASIYQKDAQRLGYRMPYPSGIEPDPSKKEYCTHWIKTGECAFISIGCKYKHEMPTPDKLRNLGFTQVPKWWKEKSAIAARGPTWMQRRLGTGAEDSKHADEMPAPRVFPDPSTFRSRQFEDRGTLQGDRVHDRTILRKDTVRESAAAPHTLLPPAPKQVAAARRESQISNLLIDLDDAPAPPPSPQLSNSSSNSVGSCDTHVPSSHTSASAPSSRAMSPIKVGESSHAVECHTGPAAPKMQHEGKDHPGQALSRRFSLRSWASVSEEDVKPAKPLTMRKIASRRYTRQPNAATKQPGLATSKHAAGYNRNKNVESHAKNANRRVALQKGFEVGATELHAKIDQLRRAPHQKERARKGTAGVDRQACAVPSANVTVKQTAA
jgi:hypothetical protein